MESLTSLSKATQTSLEMIKKLLQVLISKGFPCLAVVSWGSVTKKRFTPLVLANGTVWATPMGNHHYNMLGTITRVL